MIELGRLVEISPDQTEPFVRDVMRELGSTGLLVHRRDAEARAAAAACDAVLIFSDRVLHWLPEVMLDQTLRDLSAVSGHVIFRISTRFSSGPVGPDGANEFSSVHDAAWWRERIAAVFGAAYRITGTPREYCVILTWPPTEATLARARAAQRAARRHATWKRRGERLQGQLWRLVRPTIHESRLLTELQGCRVALVGNAQSLAERRYGGVIDSADVVVRCNRGILLDADSHGRRTDWIVTALPVSRTYFESRGVSRIVWASRRAKMMRNIPAWMFAGGCLHIFSRARNLRLKSELGKVASTGMKAIDLLAASPLLELDIYGFDFGSTNSASQPTRPMSADHDFEAERRSALRLIDSDRRIQLHE